MSSESGDSKPPSLTDETGRLTEEAACAIADALEPDDEVILGRRSRPIRVLGYEEDRHSGLFGGSDYPYHILHLRGNGTEYRLRWSHLGRYYPQLHTEGQLETRESYSVKHGEVRQKTISTERGERIRDIEVVGVDSEELPAWVLSRNIDGLDDFDGMVVEP